MDNLLPADLGLAEFVAKLIEETLEAVIASQASQIKRQYEIKDSILMPLQNFADTYISQADLLAKQMEIFPGCTIDTDALFDTDKWADALSAMDVKLYKAEDFIPDDNQTKRLTAAGALKIQNGIKLSLAKEKMGILQSLVTAGIPRLQVDSGELSAKVNFNTTKAEPANTAYRTAKPAAADKYELITKPLTGNSVLSAPINSETLPAVRVFVTQANNSNSSSSANGYGEVKIQFKTLW